jgi:23S rRNA (adenine1618-N6)-methyltransferase
MQRPPPRQPPQPSTHADAGKEVLHPRNRHRERYDFAKLIADLPALAQYVEENAYGDESIEFADPAAVKALNRALLKHFYGIAQWDIPPEFLCPPIPGRADYLHYAADLLAEGNDGVIPRGRGVQVLDIGVGANCVYPLIGQHEYGWSFVGSETNRQALTAAQKNIADNPLLKELVSCRLQTRSGTMFRGIVQPGECFDLTMCNPPFHGSLKEAQAATQRKLRNLGLDLPSTAAAPTRNFGGQETELWCPGGEAAFVERIITESASIPRSCLWFTSLISKETNLPRIMASLTAVAPRQTRVIEMAAGQKKCRMVAWTFLDQQLREAWRMRRWSITA